MHPTFNPSMMSGDELEAALIDRARIASRVFELLSSNTRNGSKHNILLVGPRGIGKSHLTALIYYRLKAAATITETQAIAYLREDEWGLTSLLDFLIRVYESLTSSDAGIRLSSTLPFGDKRSEESEQAVWNLIREFLKDRSLLVIVENLDTVLANIGLDGQQRLRGLIQTYPIWSFLATSTLISADLSDQKLPFYGFFDVIRLEELSVGGAVNLLRRLASVRGDNEMATFLTSPVGRARVRAVRHLAGGNPRIFVLFYDVLQRRGPDTALDDYIIEPLLKTIDSLTPYYQSKMASLSPLQQKIILYLCQRRVPVNVTDIANASRSSHQTAASQLKQLLASRYVRVNRLGRESYYELTEPLMRICVEAKSHDGSPLRLLVEFLRYWFYRDELEAQLASSEGLGGVKEYVLAALREYDATEAHSHLQEDIARLCSALNRASKDEEKPIAEELATVSKIAEDWGHYVRALSTLKRVAEAIPIVQKAVQAHPSDISLQLALGRAYSSSGRREDALVVYERVIAMNPKNAFAWFEKGRLLSRMNRAEDAIISFDAALQLKPSFASDIRVLKADALIRLRKYDSAMKTLRSLLQSGKEVPGVLALYGAALYRLDKWTDALQYLELATENFPADSFAWTYFGLALLKRDARDRGLEALARAHELEPGGKWISDYYCETLFSFDLYERALTELPTEIVSHQIFHLLLDTYRDHLKQGALQNRLSEIESRVEASAWQDAYEGALTQFLSYASEEFHKVEEFKELEIWQAALQELYGGQEEYAMLIQLLNALIDFKQGGGLRALLSLPLEERRLIITEEQEKALGNG